MPNNCLLLLCRRLSSCKSSKRIDKEGQPLRLWPFALHQLTTALQASKQFVLSLASKSSRAPLRTKELLQLLSSLQSSSKQFVELLSPAPLDLTKA